MNDKKPSPEIHKETANKPEKQEKEFGGFKDSGLKEPTRFGDWEVKGRCSDF